MITRTNQSLNKLEGKLQFKFIKQLRKLSMKQLNNHEYWKTVWVRCNDKIKRQVRKNTLSQIPNVAWRLIYDQILEQNKKNLS